MSNLSTLSVQQLADRYQVSDGKPYFPLNTLRLVYIIFAESIAASQTERTLARTQDILALIPMIQELLDARTAHRAEAGTSTLESEWAAVQPALAKIYQVIDTPLLRQNFEYVFSYVFPLQDTLLLSLYNDLANEKKFSIQDIFTIFHIRSMDSVLYSGVVAAVIHRNTADEELPADLQLALNYKLNALYQLNDLVDSLVYAKDDMDSQNFSPFELIKKASGDATEAKQIITSIANSFEKRIASFPLGEDTERLINEFGHTLVGVISGGK